MVLHEGAAAVVRAYVKWISRRSDIQKAQRELNRWVMAQRRLPPPGRRQYRRLLRCPVQLLREVRPEGDPDVDLEALARVIIASVDGPAFQRFSMADSSCAQMNDIQILSIQSYLASFATSPAARRRFRNPARTDLLQPAPPATVKITCRGSTVIQIDGYYDACSRSMDRQGEWGGFVRLGTLRNFAGGGDPPTSQ